LFCFSHSKSIFFQFSKMNKIHQSPIKSISTENNTSNINNNSNHNKSENAEKNSNLEKSNPISNSLEIVVDNNTTTTSTTTTTAANTEMANTSKMMREDSFIEPLIKNPFVHKLKLSFADRVKLTVGGVFLLPIRLVSILFLTGVALAVGILMTLGLSTEELETKPLSGWRKSLRSSLRFVGRAIVFCFGFHKIQKIGKRASKSEASIFVAAPHSSFFDTIVFFILGLPSSVSRAENANLPIIGRLVRALQPILVTRTDKSNKMQTINEIKKRAARDSEWPQVVLFPEGTTTNHSCLITFKPGAFIPGLPVQPVAVQYRNRLDTITWTWQGQNAYKACFLTLCQFNNKMSVSVSFKTFSSSGSIKLVERFG
jgi:hypothetical protein